MTARLSPEADNSATLSFRARKGKLSDWTNAVVNPAKPSLAEPGTSEKVIMLAARYAAGLPLWHEADRDGHHPLDDRD